jgi:hypothetical protein
MFNIVTDVNGKCEVVKTFNDYFEACDYMNDYIYKNMNSVSARHYWIEKV